MRRKQSVTRKPVSFECTGDTLIGIIDIPVTPHTVGVVIVVGGPQYRVGSHRQFVLLARAISTAGHAVLRFDHSGIGDSTGDLAKFDNLDEDIAAAIDALIDHVAEVREVVLWGLCDAASAAMMYAAKDNRISGIVLLNPWVRSEQGLAQSHLRHYYTSRILNIRFWGDLFLGNLRIGRSIQDFLKTLLMATGKNVSSDPRNSDNPNATTTESFQSRMLSGIRGFSGRVLVILSGDDITANEFQSLVRRNRAWRRVMGRTSTKFMKIDRANHTFSRAGWRQQVESWTIDWLVEG